MYSFLDNVDGVVLISLVSDPGIIRSNSQLISFLSLALRLSKVKKKKKSKITLKLGGLVHVSIENK